ncbi:MAG: hypothetical protein HY332_02295 [Chloroflexi bacterium]|nr:hypothetical protein [Chloroflexota bacterium]
MLSLVSLATYDPVADGPFDLYGRSVLIAAAAAAIVWMLLVVQYGLRSFVPVAASCVVIVAPHALHYWRITNPLLDGMPVLSISDSFARSDAPMRNWEVEASGGGSVTAEAEGLRLASGPRGVAYVRARLNQETQLLDRWRLPMALSAMQRVDEVTWRAAIQRDEAYFGVFQSKRFSIQAVRQGLLITYLDQRGDVTAAAINETFPTDGRPHTWKLVADGTSLTLWIDGRLLWSAPQREPLEEIRLGETRAEPEHGGSMLLSEASYVRRLLRPARGA